MMELTVLSFQVSTELARATRIDAARENVSRSEYIRRALVEYLNRGGASTGTITEARREVLDER